MTDKEVRAIEAVVSAHPKVGSVVVTPCDLSERGRRVIASVTGRTIDVSLDPEEVPDALSISLFFFGADTYSESDKYRLYVAAAKYADQHGFAAIWTPERHFHRVGSLYPNPSVLSAALALITRRVKLRAGSVVLPLHNIIRIVEEWAVVDNLSGGRVGVAMASGWHPTDFVLAPESFDTRKSVLAENIDLVRTLWSGASLNRPDGNGNPVDFRIFPNPIQRELPLWIAIAGNRESYAYAGSIGANIVTHLIGQTVTELQRNIEHYHRALAANGFDPAGKQVTVMVHTFVGEDISDVHNKARGPFMRYMRAHVNLLAPAFRAEGYKPEKFSNKDLDVMVEFAFERYFRTASFIGTPESCLALALKLEQIGVNEIGCLIDWMPPEETLQSFGSLSRLRQMALEAPLDRTALENFCALRLPHLQVPEIVVTSSPVF